MNVISRLCAGIVLAVSLTGCHCLQNSCAPYGGGYCGPAPTECGGCGTNCTGYGGGGFGVPLLGCNAFACAAPPVNPCPDPCVTPSRTGCCLLDGIGHILDSIHFGCGNYYSQPWVGYGNCGYNNCGCYQPMYQGPVGAGGMMTPSTVQDAPAADAVPGPGQPDP